MSISLIIPALNEAESIGVLLREVPLSQIQQVIVVDNGSTDGTAKTAWAAGAEVVVEPRRGYGYACAAGAAAGDILVFMDGDGSFVPSELARLVAPVAGGAADLVLGTRMRGARSPGAMPVHQLAGNGLVAGLLRILYRIQVTDLGPFRALRRDLLVELDMREHTYGWPVEMMVKAARRQARVVEAPVTYRPRFAGQSKVGGTVRGTVLQLIEFCALPFAMPGLIDRLENGAMIDLTLRTTAATQLPRQIYIEVTNYCNSFCVSCPLTYDHFLPLEPKHHLTWDDFRRIVDQLPQIDRAVLHGIGEPLLNRDLPRFVAHLKERGAYVLFNTNAVLLDERRGDALAATGLDELRVSLDAATPALYAKLRGIDQLPRILADLKAFVDRHGGRSTPRVSLWFVGMQENLHQLPDFVRLGAELGAPEVYLQRLVYFGDGARIAEETTMVQEQSLYAALEAKQQALILESEALAQSLGIVFQASGATTPHESVTVKGAHPWQGCMRPWTLMYITANGTALPCCISPFAAHHYQSIILGNVFSDPLAAVWNGDAYQRLRSAVISNNPAPWPCQNCGVKWSL